MDSKDVLDYSKQLFDHYSTEKEPREKFLFAKALQSNEQLHEDVKRDFFARVELICDDENHREQKLAFRKILLENIKNMVMWQEFFKRESEEESKLIYSFLKESFQNVSHDEFEKQSAYFQLYSEALYSLTQSVLNRYYDEVIENNYSTMLTKAWRIYFENYFNSILAKVQGKEYSDEGSLVKLNQVLKKVEAAALQGEDLAYNMDGI